jgi:AraC-like DNA-binding protein
MRIDAFHLPDHFNRDKRSDVCFYHYISNELNVRHKIILSQNLICILVKGTKEIFGSHDSIKIDNTEILLLTSGSVLMWESSAEDDNLESFLIFFSNQLLKEFCAKHNPDILKAGGKSAPIMSLKKDEFIQNFQNSLRLLDEKHFAPLQRLKLEELLVYLVLSNNNNAVHAFIRKALQDSSEDKLRQVVVANAKNALTTDELAFLCNMSTSTFKRHFAKAFQCSPKKYLTDKKMEKARELLLLDKRPSDIYLDLGYQSLPSFSTEFKKYFGISPKKFQLNFFHDIKNSAQHSAVA